MHFVESLAVGAGLKYSRPFIEESFFPIVPEKYITFCTENHQSKQWDHFQEYLNTIAPILRKNDIGIVEIGSNDVKLSSQFNLKKVTGPNHWSYIIKKSLLHVGPENFISQIASFHNTPLIAFFSNTSPEYCAPLWSKPENQILIQADLKSQKPSFLGEEPVKTINSIPPERVANETLNLLGIKNDFDKYEVVNIGNSFNQTLIEVVPDFLPEPSFFPKSLINIRMDYHFNESSLPDFCNNRKIAIVSDREININLLLNIKPSLENTFFKVDEESSQSYFKKLKNLGIPFSLIAKRESDLPATRLKFFDWEVQEDIPRTKKELDNIDKICDTTCYKSSRKIFSSDGQFSSKSSFDKKIKKHEDQLIIDEDEFWEDSDYFKLYNLKKDGKKQNR